MRSPVRFCAGASVAAALLAAGSSLLGQTPTCARRPPAGSPAFDSAAVAALAGTYEMTLVDSTAPRGHPLASNVLVLRPTAGGPAASVPSLADSARRVSGAPQPPWGYLTGELRLSGIYIAATGRTPERPGVRVLSSGRILLGEAPAVTRLRLTHAGPLGFWGAWEYAGGLGPVACLDAPCRPPPGGHFCALRR